MREREENFTADRIPVVEYHNPNYNDLNGNVVMTEGIFTAQLDYFARNTFKTLTDHELADFLSKEGQFTDKSVVLRFDLGDRAFNEFENIVIPELRKRRMVGHFYIAVGEIEDNKEGKAYWDKIVRWYEEGIIVVGSHSVSHPDFRQISLSWAQEEARKSKEKIKEEFKKRGVNMDVVGFAFPFDSVPEKIQFLKNAGYEYALAGRLNPKPVQDYAKYGDFLIPSIYPYTSKRTLDAIGMNRWNNGISIPFNNGYVFSELMLETTRPISWKDLNSEGKQALPFGMQLPLTELKSETRVMKPSAIIIHTDGQEGTNPQLWNTRSTYNGLLGRNLTVHFGIDSDSTYQFLFMGRDYVEICTGARGFNDAISIEMAGKDYNEVAERRASSEKTKVVDAITQRTIELVGKLMNQYGISYNNVLGHYEASASGKADPGNKYMEQYFRPKLQVELEKYRKTKNVS
jgi:peptidoglycan/xylan/chitin deacetylase (PgdA/CDA1 family)